MKKLLFVSLIAATFLSIASPAGASIQPTHNLTIALTAFSPAPAFGQTISGGPEVTKVAAKADAKKSGAKAKVKKMKAKKVAKKA